MINVTKAFLPPFEDYVKYLEGIWSRCHLTNHGPLVNELEEGLKSYLGVNHFFFINNGTFALQLAIKALELEGEIITTPFSYVATTSSIVWENAQPVFVDINPQSLTIDADRIEAAITKRTSAILATHVYGIPCEVEKIQAIAEKYNLKVIYDAAHAFAVKYKGQSILNYGDVSTLSFHATKLFHTVEGGGVVTNSAELMHRLSYMRNFGHKGQEEFWGLGVNGKNSEFHAAMGLCIFPHIGDILAQRKELSETYDSIFRTLDARITRPALPPDTEYNYAYYPVIFENEKQLLTVRDVLNATYIYPRRYFYPSLDTLPYLKKETVLPVSNSIAARVLCLPLYHGLTKDVIRRICNIIGEVLKY
ncbi:MAG: aminotransferase DegT [Sphingobacteriales bacterium 50-39]|nr:DegT/DnrJ/EryC1/StrS family aminotransferase [Sphingobacteriales bacterium]OJW56828.1 MAG: aminotransferase DegT [Sphingobacteriales bacterium 50-39]